MNKKEFFREVNRYLADLNDSERSEFVSYYEEMIDDYLENGLNEHEAIEKMGSPKEIATKILEETRNAGLLVQDRKSVLEHFFVLITFPIWGTLILALCIMIICVPISLLSIEIGLLVVGIVSIIGTPLVMLNLYISVGIVQFGVGMICVGILIILLPVLLLCYRKTKLWIIRIMKRMVHSLRGEN